ncbi:hypothetical protein Tco_1170621, partial [Tanacetum coccineum]
RGYEREREGERERRRDSGREKGRGRGRERRKEIERGRKRESIKVMTQSAAFGWLLEEIHVTWAHLEKKGTRLRLYTKSLEEIRIQTVKMALRFLATTSDSQDGV